jgi:N-acetylmuramoyl-L-alanine amidase CwlA
MKRSKVLAASGNHGGYREPEQILYLVIHYTGNDGDKAMNNAKYYRNTVVKASAHYFVDDEEIVQSVEDLTVAWAVGGKKWSDTGKTGGGTMYGKITNTNSISVELCDTVRNGRYEASEKTLENAVVLCKELMERYNIPMENVYRHFDVSGKHCPAYFMEEETWQAFKNRLEGKTVVYKYLSEVPEKFRPIIEALMNANIIQGDGSDKEGNGDVINLSHEQVRTLVFLYRGGGFDKKLEAMGMEPAVE